MGRADRAVPRARRRSRATATTFPGSRAQQERRRVAAWSTRTPAATSAPATAGERASPICRPARRTASTRRSTSPATTRSSASTAPATSAIADFVWKYAPNGNARRPTSSCRASTSGGARRGDFTYDRGRRAGPDAAPRDYASPQSGWYLQGVYQFMPYWRVGACATIASIPDTPTTARTPRSSPRRVQSAAHVGDARLHAVGIQPHPPAARRRPDAAGVTDNQLFLQYILTLGAHGAHRLLRSSHEIASVQSVLLHAGAALAWLLRSAALNVFATVPEWGALAEELGGDKVKVYTATNALQDPHHVEAKPSLIARARGADLVVATGAELEIGWLPLVLQQAGNPKVRAGQARLLRGRAVRAAARQAGAPRSRRRRRASRRAIRTSRPTRAISHASPGRSSAKLAELDPANAAYYQARYKAFSERWTAAIARWEKEGAPLKGVADRRAAQGVHLSDRVAGPEGGRGAGAEAGRSSRRPRICPKCWRRCSASRSRW